MEIISLCTGSGRLRILMNKDMLGWFLALVICLIGWAQWLYFRKKLDFNHSINRLLLHALEELYKGQFVGGCNKRYDGPPCHDATTLRDLCAPCFGRRILNGPREVVSEIIDPKKEQQP